MKKLVVLAIVVAGLFTLVWHAFFRLVFFLPVDISQALLHFVVLSICFSIMLFMIREMQA